MENTIEQTNSKWTDAAQDAVFLSLFTVGVQLISCVLTSIGIGDSGISGTVIGFVLWSVKFGGSLWFLLRCLKRFAASSPGCSVFAQGMRTCLLSSTICAAFTFLMYSALFPGLANELFAQATASLGGIQLPDEAETALLRIQDNFAQYMALATFFWGLFCGFVFCGILAPAAQRSADIFGGQPEDGGNEEDELA